MDAETLREYKKRWDIINAFETEEIINTSVEDKWKIFNSIYNLSVKMNIYESKSDLELNEVRNRWIKLKDLYKDER